MDQRLRNLSLVAVIVAVSACSGSGGASPSAATAAPSGSAATTRIEVQLTDALRIDPAQMIVPAGKPLTFVVTNAGAIEHEFYLGDEAGKQSHEKEMASMGGMRHDDPQGIGVKPGETKELVSTFAQAGQTLAGCHVAGHYAGGMKATINVIG